MSDRTITAIHQETLRLIGHQQEQLRDLLRIPDLLKGDRSEKQQRSVTRADAELWIQTLADEAVKVGRLEMTLAVVGTMKAGKSTTINAIVGSEVLPNRNHPMTTLPTIIRHTPGQIDPVLTFAKPEPFNRAITDLRTALQRMERERTLRSLLFGASEDEQALIGAILSGKLKSVPNRHAGAQAIFDFLKALNDISRLCESLPGRVESPLKGYTSIDELPVISVEFFHLRGHTTGVGTFSLIDTPGPNEAGQHRLREIMDDQLAKASAVLAVSDYTQLNGKADYEVRERLLDLAGSRLFVLVNKFDQKCAHGMKAPDVKTYVADRLFEQRISQDQVYPVAGKYAYLAKRAQREVELYGRLPIAEEWVKDFAQLAFGALWDESQLEDRAQVAERATALWTASRFDQPLSEVIVRASSRAAFISLDAATEKMLRYDQLLLQLLELRSKGATTDLANLRSHIASLEADIRTIGEAHTRAKSEVNGAVGALRREIGGKFASAHTEVQKAVDAFFRKGKLDEQQRKKAEKKGSENIWDYFGGGRQLTWDPEGTNSFSSRDEAVKFISELNEALQEIVAPLMGDLEKAAAREVERLQSDMWPRINNHVGAVLKKAEAGLKESFKVTIKIPTPRLGKVAVDFDEIQSGVVQHERRTVTRYYQKRVWWKLWLGTVDVPYQSEESVYKVSTKEMGKNVQVQLRTSREKFEAKFNDYVETQLLQQIEEYFAEMTTFLDRFRGDLLDAMENSRLETTQLQQLMKAMASELVKVQTRYEDVADLRRDLPSLE